MWLKIYAELKTFNTKLQSKNDQTNRISNAEEYKSQTHDMITEFGPRPTSPLKPVTLENSTITTCKTARKTVQVFVQQSLPKRSNFERKNKTKLYP